MSIHAGESMINDMPMKMIWWMGDMKPKVKIRLLYGECMPMN